ncbi:MAG: glycine--tRNA ligase subunit beta [Acidobacteriaceae bacterium]
MADLLLEIGTEEIPARMIASATEELTRRVTELLVRERLGSGPEIEAFSTPRRLAVLARGIASSQPDIEEQVTGPSVKVAFKDGKPTPAAEAFAKKVNIAVNRLQTTSTPKGEYLSATVKKTGRVASDLLVELLPKELAGIYWAKNMYWRAGKPERFVRPVRWMVAMLDSQVIPVEFGGVTAGNATRGHRILESQVSGRKSQEDSQLAIRNPQTLLIGKPAEYADVLKNGFVVPTYAEREHRIRKALDAATRTVAGARWREDKDLLATVVNLTEYPSVILGNFDREYLTLPEEVLVTVMRDHQKYFAVEDEQGKLAPHFLAVLNTEVDAEGQAIIRHGNERVLRARFNDARFFWDTDQKHPLRDRVESLKNVTFQKDLGSYYDKTIRVQRLASLVSETLRDSGIAVRPGIVHKAAMLAKTDLTTELVKEFTELQGIIGGLYTKKQLEETQQLNPGPIGDAIYDQYKPESTDDELPRTTEGAILALADKADSIAGMFALGLIPSGSKDPFALRRAANGIVRICAEKKFPISLSVLMQNALAEYRSSEAEKRFTSKTYNTDVASFFRERIEFYLRDVRGFAYDVVNAVLAAGSDIVPDAAARAEAAAKVRDTEDFEAISVAFKRIKNILRQATEAGKWSADGERAVASDGDEPAERALAQQGSEYGTKVRELTSAGKYDEALSEIARMRKPLDKFFDDVMVMVDDETVRTRRLDLLNSILGSFTTIADFSEIVTEKK